MLRVARNPALRYAALVVLFAILAVLLLWAFSGAHDALEYMVAGTLATTLAIAAVFLALVKRRLL
jgi:hypothetical protein